MMWPETKTQVVFMTFKQLNFLEVGFVFVLPVFGIMNWNQSGDPLVFLLTLIVAGYAVYGRMGTILSQGLRWLVNYNAEHVNILAEVIDETWRHEAYRSGLGTWTELTDHSYWMLNEWDEYESKSDEDP